MGRVLDTQDYKESVGGLASGTSHAQCEMEEFTDEAHSLQLYLQ
jgi:hypothetical protein